MKLPYHLKKNYDITLLSAFKTHATAEYFFDIHDRTDIEHIIPIVHFAQEQHLPYCILGAGTNCLFAFDHFPGLIIRNRYSGWEAPFDREGKWYVRIHSGESTNTVAQQLYEHHGISTLIPWVWLPWTFGGATLGNAGCFWVEMSDIFVEATVIDMVTGEEKIFSHSDMHFSYRNSVLKNTDHPYCIVSTLIDLSPRLGEYESYTPENLRSIRKLKQPAGISCWSFFTNPPGFSAGKLIDDAGLKWYRIGGIKVSEHHGNFFINDQKGTWQDILALRDRVKEKIREMYQIELHEEVRIFTANTSIS
jgi:UDP-N-acetylmuramate dehydrogenase